MPILDTYPHSAGHKEKGGTSQEAAESMRARAATLRAKVLDLLRSGTCLTADEIAGRLGESIPSIRPRLSELAADGLVVKTATRRPNASGKSAVVWSAYRPNEQIPLFPARARA